MPCCLLAKFIVSIDTLTSQGTTVTYSIVSVIVIVVVLSLLLLLLLLLLWKRRLFSKKKSHTIEIPQENEDVIAKDLVCANEACTDVMVMEISDNHEVQAAESLEEPEEDV